MFYWPEFSLGILETAKNIRNRFGSGLRRLCGGNRQGPGLRFQVRLDQVLVAIADKKRPGARLPLARLQEKLGAVFCF